MSNNISVVVDTNVVISAFWGGNPEQIMMLFFSEKLDLFYSHEILKEYTQVLFRPKFSSISEERRKLLLEAIINLGYLVVPVCQITQITNDSSDNKFLECAVSAQTDYLITGNTQHFNFSEYEGVQIRTPGEFLLENQSLIQ